MTGKRISFSFPDQNPHQLSSQHLWWGLKLSHLAFSAPVTPVNRISDSDWPVSDTMDAVSEDWQRYESKCVCCQWFSPWAHA